MSVLLPTHSVEKIWGRTDLPASFDCPPGARIGEIWFEPPPAVPALLVKYLFTSEKLSVQVHPGAGQAPAGMSGKEECWYILDAEPDARIAIGFDSPLGAGELRSAAIDGSIEQLLTWHEVRPGDFFYIPAGTVHAIGAGISLIELQQNCDITYRLYDYGRPRELHLDAAIEVAQRDPHPDELRRSAASSGQTRLVDGPHFDLWQLDGAPDAHLAAELPGASLLIPLAGEYCVLGQEVPPGTCALVPVGAGVACTGGGKALLACARG
ncbi:MAG: mannose-6-phosphate isomerase [Erythrobacter sp. RIFCSPHIGHO2_12_FULL_63_10]|nr:MAG: mannose-6-phosphate isomerase [Erythrobacter sp. RIFCSPHIGHO2_12_FULL_63_10]